MRAKPKMTINQLAAANARHALRLKRKSALPASRSGVVGRSLPVKVEAVEEQVEIVAEESAEDECTS